MFHHEKTLTGYHSSQFMNTPNTLPMISYDLLRHWWSASWLMVVYCIADISDIVISYRGEISVWNHQYQWHLGNSTSIPNITQDGHIRKTGRWTMHEHQNSDKFTRNKKNCFKKIRRRFCRVLVRKVLGETYVYIKVWQMNPWGNVMGISKVSDWSENDNCRYFIPQSIPI